MSSNVDIAKVDLVSLAVLFISIVATALLLIAVASEHSSPFLVIPPVALGVWSILNLRR